MKKRMLVEQDPHQTRIAILEDDRVAEILVENRRRKSLVGAIFKGRVTRVLPGMQAAFVHVGLERDAFLYVADAQPGDSDATLAAAVGEAPEAEPEGPGEGASIEDLVVQGEEILVQVRKDPLSHKGARVTTQIALPSRYLVLLPGSSHLGISRRIEDEVERARLRELLVELKPEGAGLIVRTEAEGCSRSDLEPDLEALLEEWHSISVRAEEETAPVSLHRDLELGLRAVRDVFGEDFAEVRVDAAEVRDAVVGFLDASGSGLSDRVLLDEGPGRLFQRFGVDREIEASLESRVWLRSGGYLVIHPTEALVAIDVNTGRFVGGASLEETVLRTNLEAVEEVVRQIRLRDLGGILVIDFIDMEDQTHRDRVFAALERELEKDRARTRVLNISEFGLVELTRKRSRTNLRSLLTEPCPICSGSGRVRRTSSVCLDLRRAVLQHLDRPAAGGGTRLMLRVHPEVAAALADGEKAVLDEIEALCGDRVVLRSDPGLRREHFDVVEL
ncbi:MAG: Rne/Rng family ribonuclease [Thermoanaerobaculia bacterium]|nr:Rne/Rng family ribonuclease [Thermoanaerobaculia bacterium]